MNFEFLMSCKYEAEFLCNLSVESKVIISVYLFSLEFIMQDGIEDGIEDGLEQCG
ncbi:hypothetical protein Syun_025422 [Stephania yunnanensis]|uniref:Uncharacterized protein n=1 Tax=Stephania yunnanensis TaxID=152371 RepID=A0AAP0EUJ9_9MAGN